MTDSPQNLRLRAKHLDRLRAVHGRGLAAAIRQAALDLPEDVDLSPMIPIKIRLGDEVEAALDALAAKHGLTRTMVLQRIVEQLTSGEG